MDKIQFEQIFKEWYNPLCNYARRILNDDGLATDVVHDTFLYFWEKRDTIDPGQGIGAYLFKVTYHRALKVLRDKNMVEFTNDIQDNCHVEDTIEKDSELYGRKEKIMEALRHLPPKCREVFVLSRQYSLTYTQIADKLKISPKTVENHIVKALAILRKNYSK